MRKWILSTVMILSIAVVLMGCSSKSSTDGGENDSKSDKVSLSMFVWAGANQDVVPKQVVADYIAKNPNVEVEIIESSNAVMYPQMLANKKTNPDDPLVNFGYFNVNTTLQGVNDNMWESLNPDIITNMANIPQDYHTEDNKGIIWGISDFALVYNKDLVKTPPTSWHDLWENDEFKDKVALWDYLFYSFLPPIIDLKGEELGATYKNPEAAFNYIDENISQIRSLVTSADQLQNLLVSGEATIAPYSVQSSQVWIEDGAPLEIVIPEEGSIPFPYYLQVVNGSTPEQIRVANEIINELLSAENLEKYAEATGTPVTNSEAAIPEKYKNDPAFNLENRQNTKINPDWETITTDTSEWSELWDRTIKRSLR